MNKKLGESKLTLRESEEQFEVQTGLRSEVLEQYDLPLPYAAAHVWQWFQEISAGRQNGMSINPISHTEIYCWSQLTGIRLAPWEVQAIKGIDSVFVASILEDRPKPKAKKP